MKILILGANSYVGARLYYEFRDQYEVIGTYHNNQLCSDFIQLDILDANAVDTVIGTYMPDYIIHCANSASNAWCSQNPELAQALNQDATVYIADSAKKYGSTLIFISSIMAQYDTPYGRLKKASETIIKQSRVQYCIVRPSLIVGSSPKCRGERPFNRILNNIIDLKPAVYSSFWKFQPTSLHQLSETIAIIINRKITNETITVCVPEHTNRYQLAADILGHFQIPVTETIEPEANERTKVLLDHEQHLGLPIPSYGELIDQVVDEINNRDRWTL